MPKKSSQGTQNPSLTPNITNGISQSSWCMGINRIIQQISLNSPKMVRAKLTKTANQLQAIIMTNKRENETICSLVV